MPVAGNQTNCFTRVYWQHYLALGCGAAVSRLLLGCTRRMPISVCSCIMTQQPRLAGTPSALEMHWMAYIFTEFASEQLPPARPSWLLRVLESRSVLLLPPSDETLVSVYVSVALRASVCTANHEYTNTHDAKCLESSFIACAPHLLQIYSLAPELFLQG